MRACFLKSNICALGYGVAIVQTTPAPEIEQPRSARKPEKASGPLVTGEGRRLNPH